MDRAHPSELRRHISAASARCEQAIAISRQLLDENHALRASVADTVDSIHRRRTADRRRRAPQPDGGSQRLHP